MRLKQLLFIICFILLANASWSQNKFQDQKYNRKSFSLHLKKDGKFKNNDTLLSNFKSGTYELVGKNLILTSKVNDTITATEKLNLVFSSPNKITLAKNDQRFSFHDEESTSKNIGISFNSIFRGIIGLLFLFLVGYLFSRSRKDINWSTVIRGTLLQIILAILILKVPFFSGIFEWLAKAFARVIDFAHEGATFLFGAGDYMAPMLKNFAFWILPSVIFFSALSSVLYYFGILQFIVKGMAYVMKRVLGISGSESVAAAANIFIGQTEAPLLVKPYLGRMTKSEILCLMVGGMATISG